jgi:hypothetical protein
MSDGAVAKLNSLHLAHITIIMEDTGRTYTDKYKEIMNDWYYSSCILTSLTVSDSENYQHLLFAAHTVHG